MPRPPPSPVDLFPDLREGGGRTRCSRLPRQHRSKHRHRPLHHGTDANTRYSTPCITLVKTQVTGDVLMVRFVPAWARLGPATMKELQVAADFADRADF